jgi:hypothetical protein
MSLEDRDYMRSNFDPREEKPARPSLIKSFIFLLWRIIRVPFKKRKKL